MLIVNQFNSGISVQLLDTLRINAVGINRNISRRIVASINQTIFKIWNNFKSINHFQHINRLINYAFSGIFIIKHFLNLFLNTIGKIRVYRVQFKRIVEDGHVDGIVHKALIGDYCIGNCVANLGKCQENQ